MKHLENRLERCFSHQSLLYWGGKYKCAIKDLLFMEVQAHFYRKKIFVRTGVLRGKKIYSGVTASQRPASTCCKEDKSSFGGYQCKPKPLIKTFISAVVTNTYSDSPLSIPLGLPGASPAPNLTRSADSQNNLNATEALPQEKDSLKYSKRDQIPVCIQSLYWETGH